MWKCTLDGQKQKPVAAAAALKRNGGAVQLGMPRSTASDVPTIKGYHDDSDDDSDDAFDNERRVPDDIPFDFSFQEKVLALARGSPRWPGRVTWMVEQTSRLIDEALGTVHVMYSTREVVDIPVFRREDPLSQLRSNLDLVLKTFSELRVRLAGKLQKLLYIFQNSINVCDELDRRVQHRNRMLRNHLHEALDVLREFRDKGKHRTGKLFTMRKEDKNIAAERERFIRGEIKRLATNVMESVREMRLRTKRVKTSNLNDETQEQLQELRENERWFQDFHPGMIFLECECDIHTYYRDTLYYGDEFALHDTRNRRGHRWRADMRDNFDDDDDYDDRDYWDADRWDNAYDDDDDYDSDPRDSSYDRDDDPWRHEDDDDDRYDYDRDDDEYRDPQTDELAELFSRHGIGYDRDDSDDENQAGSRALPEEEKKKQQGTPTAVSRDDLYSRFRPASHTQGSRRWNRAAGAKSDDEDEDGAWNDP